MGAKTRKFGVADRARFFQPIELFDFIRGTKANRAPKRLTRLLGLLHTAFRQAPSLRDQIRKDTDIRDQDQDDYPDCLAPARNVVASEKVARNRNEQPEPHDEDEYREDIHEEISIGESLLKKEHCDFSLRLIRRCVLWLKIDRIKPLKTRVRADRDLAQRGPGRNCGGLDECPLSTRKNAAQLKMVPHNTIPTIANPAIA
jgi:hypothetical protein